LLERERRSVITKKCHRGWFLGLFVNAVVFGFQALARSRCSTCRRCPIRGVHF
jgi:hypothetical protein